MSGKQLGQSGINIPEVGLGTCDYTGGVAPLQKGFAEGALFVDTAESYGTEPVVGQAVKGIRDRVFIATKISPAHFRAAEVLKAADRSLQQLQVDHLDLYQLHYPSYSVPMEETLGAMEQLVEVGKVRFIGVSNFTVSQLRRAQQALRKNRIVSNQVRYNLADRTIEPKLLPYCQSNRITVIAYSPLARKFRRITDGDPRGTLAELAKSLGKTPAQVAINWCLCKDCVVAIPKASSVEHVVDDCGASGWRLSAGQIALLDANVRFRRRSFLENLLRNHTPRSLIRLAAKIPGKK